MTSPTSLQTRILPKKKSRIRVLDSSVQIVCEDDPGKISWKWGKNGVFAPNKAKKLIRTAIKVQAGENGMRGG